MRIVLATNNANKVQELKTMLKECSSVSGVSCISDTGLAFVPQETGGTFEANAMQKAVETAEFLAKNGYDKAMIVADDSGLEIDALGGEPGVDSALYMGRETPYTIRNARIIELLADVPDEKRTARFVCVIACIMPCGEKHMFRGKIEGIIAREQRGENGFGYDPIFLVPEYGKVMAELSSEEKNAISHRWRALGQIVEMLDAQDTPLDTFDYELAKRADNDTATETIAFDEIIDDLGIGCDELQG